MHEAIAPKAGQHEASPLEEELLRLALPPLADTAFLELGCADGFYCGFAWFEGAREILGVDADEQALAQARARFPHCRFSGLAGNLAKVLTRRGVFDVILCSSLPPSVDVAAILPLLMAALARKGTLVLKTAVKETPGPAARTLAEAAYRTGAQLPAESGLAAALEPYVYKDMGESVFTDARGRKKHILHVRNRAPYAILLMGDSASGKSTVARKLFAGLPVIHGDPLLTQIAALPPGSLAESYPLLDDLCSGGQSTMSGGRMMIQIFNSAAGKQYARLVAELAGGRDFVYEGVIHRNFQHVFRKQLEMLGYAVLTLDTPAPEIAPRDLFRQAREEARKYRLFLEGREACGA